MKVTSIIDFLSMIAIARGQVPAWQHQSLPKLNLPDVYLSPAQTP
jgi:hypothetical protein